MDDTQTDKPTKTTTTTEDGTIGGAILVVFIGYILICGPSEVLQKTIGALDKLYLSACTHTEIRRNCDDRHTSFATLNLAQMVGGLKTAPQSIAASAGMMRDGFFEAVDTGRIKVVESFDRVQSHICDCDN